MSIKFFSYFLLVSFLLLWSRIHNNDCGALTFPPSPPSTASYTQPARPIQGEEETELVPRRLKLVTRRSCPGWKLWLEDWTQQRLRVICNMFIWEYVDSNSKMMIAFIVHRFLALTFILDHSSQSANLLWWKKYTVYYYSRCFCFVGTQALQWHCAGPCLGWYLGVGPCSW